MSRRPGPRGRVAGGFVSAGRARGLAPRSEVGSLRATRLWTVPTASYAQIAGVGCAPQGMTQRRELMDLQAIWRLTACRSPRVKRALSH
jgi:hypothetical protein